MKKAILLLALCAFLFSSCSFGKSGANAPDDPPIPDSYDESLNDNLWVQDHMKYLPSFQVSEEYEALIGDQSRIEAFQKQFEQFGSGGTRDQYEYNVYTLIRENGIPKKPSYPPAKSVIRKTGSGIFPIRRSIFYTQITQRRFTAILPAPLPCSSASAKKSMSRAGLPRTARKNIGTPASPLRCSGKNCR